MRLKRWNNLFKLNPAFERTRACVQGSSCCKRDEGKCCWCASAFGLSGAGDGVKFFKRTLSYSYQRSSITPTPHSHNIADRIRVSAHACDTLSSVRVITVVCTRVRVLETQTTHATRANGSAHYTRKCMQANYDERFCLSCNADAVAPVHKRACGYIHILFYFNWCAKNQTDTIIWICIGNCFIQSELIFNYQFQKRFSCIAYSKNRNPQLMIVIEFSWISNHRYLFDRAFSYVNRFRSWRQLSVQSAEILCAVKIDLWKLCARSHSMPPPRRRNFVRKTVLQSFPIRQATVGGGYIFDFLFFVRVVSRTR